MSELANYSIETDHTVLLAFKDGRRLRVPVGQLTHHLAAPDLEKVLAALRLRRDFIRRHMPKAALVLVAGGLIALLAMGGHMVAEMMGSPRTLPAAPDHTGIVRSESLPTPMASSAPQTGTSGVAGTAASQPATVIRQALHKRTVAFGSAAKPQRLVPSRPLGVPGSLVSPSPSPLVSPLPSLTPSPSASPVPPADKLATGEPPSQPQVLGSCTSPDPGACTDSSSSTPQIP